MDNEIVGAHILICEFMQYQKCQRCEDCGGYKIGPVIYLPREMEFNSSWNWIMPVVEKIEAVNNSEYGFTIDPWGIQIIEYKTGNENVIVNIPREGEPLLQIYFLAVTEFISSYPAYPPSSPI